MKNRDLTVTVRITKEKLTFSEDIGKAMEAIAEKQAEMLKNIDRNKMLTLLGKIK